MDKAFEPRIIAFCCNWCAYAGADMAGVSRLKMPPTFRIIRVMCTGRVDPLFIIHAFVQGADGVIVAGCHPGDCHYISGNLKAKQRINFLKGLLKQTGLDNRLEMYYVSAGESNRFQEVIEEFTERIRKLGPNPLKKLPPPKKEGNKREVLHTELLWIFKGLGITEIQPWQPSEEEIIPGFGTPVYDPEKCVGCGACYNNCPENVIMLEDVDGKRKIRHYYWSCITCRTCEEICPQDAIKVEEGFDLTAFLQQTLHDDIELPLVKCRICGKFFASEPMVKEAKEKEIPLELLDVCPECRKELIGKELVELLGHRGL